MGCASSTSADEAATTPRKGVGPTHQAGGDTIVKKHDALIESAVALTDPRRSITDTAAAHQGVNPPTGTDVLDLKPSSRHKRDQQDIFPGSASKRSQDATAMLLAEPQSQPTSATGRPPRSYRKDGLASGVVGSGSNRKMCSLTSNSSHERFNKILTSVVSSRPEPSALSMLQQKGVRYTRYSIPMTSFREAPIVRTDCTSAIVGSHIHNPSSMERVVAALDATLLNGQMSAAQYEEQPINLDFEDPEFVSG